MKNTYLLLLSLLVGASSFAQLPGWNHVQPITIQENSATQLLNYQLEIHLNTQALVGAGEMLATGDDIRFTSSCAGSTNYSYWIESGMNTTDTKIWVKIDTLPASGTKTIYMHYGNTSASLASSIPGTFLGPHSSTDSVSSGAPGGVGNSQRGFRFAPNQDVLVTAFGKYEPTGTQRYVTLFDFSTQAILRQSQVSGPAAQYSYGNIASPIWLTSGTQYLLELYQGSSDGYYFGNSSQIGQHLTYYDMRYCNSCTENTFPTNTLSNYHYGCPDLWYFTKNTASVAPTYTFTSHTINLASDSVAVCFNDSVQLQAGVTGGFMPYTYSWTTTQIDDATSPTPNVFPSASMYYVVSVTDGCGVVATDSVHVTVNALPSFSVDALIPLICNGDFSEVFASVGVNYTYLWSNGSTSSATVVYPTTTTLYSVTVTDTVLQCSNIGYVEVAVNVPLTATHDVEICAGQTHIVGIHAYDVSGTYVDTIAGVTFCDSIVTTNLVVNDLLTGTQNINLCFGQALVIGSNVYTVAGTYVDTLSNGGICDSVITTVLTFEPEIDATIQQVGSFLTVPSGADSYQWFDCNLGQAVAGETQSSFEPTQNGTYQCYVGVNGCVAPSACLTINDVSLYEPSELSPLSVFPNPTKGEVKVLSGISQEIIFVDATGKELKRTTLKANETTTISLSGFAAGVYFIKHGSLVTRLVIE